MMNTIKMNVTKTLIILFLLINLNLNSVQADNWTQTSDTNFETGTLENIEIINTGEGAKLQLKTENELGIWYNQGLKPSDRYESGMVYDSINNQVLMFGGMESLISYFRDTWIYNLETDTWKNMNPTIKPSARAEHAMSFDSKNGRIVLFGGTDQTTSNDETWIYDFDSNIWTEKSTGSVTKPSARCSHDMVYDSENDKIVLYGGDQGKDETWVYDIETDIWVEKSTSGTSGIDKPPLLFWHAMAYDSYNRKVVLFGGMANTYPYFRDETWIYDLLTDTWTQKSTGGTSGIDKPLGRYGHDMVYDNVNKKIILFGGTDGAVALGDTWSYDTTTDSWTKLRDGGSADEPSIRRFHSMVYYSSWDKTVLFGGQDFSSKFGDIWTYDLLLNIWEEKNPTTKPSARCSHDMVYDSANNKVVLFGGRVVGVNDDTWIYDIAHNKWTQNNPNPKPSARENHAMVYDSANNKVVLFGGWNGGSSIFGDTWLYDVASDTWTQMVPSYKDENGNLISPISPRSKHAMAYDSLNNKVVLFGGSDSSGFNADTWTYDVATMVWTKRTTSTQPSARYSHAMVYDLENKLIVLFGGFDSSGLNGQTWVYDVPFDIWTLKTPIGPINPPPQPSARSSHEMVYDMNDNIIVLFGGSDINGRNDETWIYNTALNEWILKNPIEKPTARNLQGMVYHSLENKIILFGGWDTTYNDETWIFNCHNYFNVGSYISDSYTYNIHEYKRITWRINIIPDGFIRFQVAVSEDGDIWNYVGPDGTSLTYYDEITGGNLYNDYNGQFLRFKAYFSTHYCGNTPILYDVSFTFTEEKEPYMEITSPNGGEDWMKGSSYPITWNARGDFDSTSISLFHSVDSGNTWTPIVEGIPNTGYFSWFVPGENTAGALIKVIATDIYNNEVSDTSDTTFAIDPPISNINFNPNNDNENTFKNDKNNGQDYSLELIILSTFIIMIIILITLNKIYSTKKIKNNKRDFANVKMIKNSLSIKKYVNEKKVQKININNMTQRVKGL